MLYGAHRCCDATKRDPGVQAGVPVTLGGLRVGGDLQFGHYVGGEFL